MKDHLKCLNICVLLLSFAPITLWAQPRVGLNGTPCQWETIAEGIANAGDRDTVYVAAGNYAERPGTIYRSISLTAATGDCSAATDAMVVVNGRSRELGVFEVVGGADPIQVTFDRFEIREGDGESGGLIQINDADVTLNDSLLGNASAKLGGCISIAGGGLTLNRTKLNGCHADNDGGGIYAQDARVELVDFSRIEHSTAESGSGGAFVGRNSQIVLTDSILRLNTAGSDGGAIHLSDVSSLLVDNSDLSENQSQGNGGALFADASAVTMVNFSSVDTNTSALDGGGFFLSSSADLITDNSSFSGNTALGESGGALRGDSNQMTLTDTYLGGNIAPRSGGAISVSMGTVTMTGGRASSNQTQQTSSGGAGLHATESVVVLDGVDFQANSSAANGGAVYLQSTPAEIRNCEFLQNEAVLGGALVSEPVAGDVVYALTIEDSEFIENEAIVSQINGIGGALYLISVDLDLSRNRFTRNTAAGSGGGISASESQLTIVDTVFEENRSFNFHGGAIRCGGCPEFVLRQSTLMGNTAPEGDGGALWVSAQGPSSSLIENTRFVGNSAGSRGGGAYLQALSATIRGVATGGEACSVVALGPDTYCSEFSLNSAQSGGALTVVSGLGLGSNTRLQQTAFLANSASAAGTAIQTISANFNPEPGQLTLENVLVADQTGPSSLAETISFDSMFAGSFDSTTVAGNVGAAIRSEGLDSFLSLSNTVFWDNGEPSFASLLDTTTELLGCNYSEPEEPGSWNLGSAVDPLFVTDLDRGNYRLDPLNSPLIDTCSTGPIEDLDGGGRPAGALWEPGAFEVDALDSVQLLAVQPGQGVTTSEDGGVAEISVSLMKAPVAGVTLLFASTDPGEGELLENLLTFGPDNWDVSQSVTVSGVDDNQDDGDQEYVIQISTETEDLAFQGLAMDIPAVNLDDDEEVVLGELIFANGFED